MHQRATKLLITLMALFAYCAQAQTTILSNDFEVCESGYSTFGSYTDGSSDYFIRTDGTNGDTACVSVSTSGQIAFTNTNGFYYTGEDTDRPTENPNTTGEFGSTPLTSGVHFNDIDVSGFDQVSLSCSFAATSVSAFENGDYIRIYVDKTNNGTYELLAAFETQNGLGNDSLSWDTDLDGAGDSTILSEAFQSFTFEVVGATTMDVRIEMLSSAGSEEIAFDSFSIQGTNSDPTLIAGTDFENCQGNYSEYGVYTDGSSDYFIRTNGVLEDTNCAASVTSGDITFTNTDGFYYTAEDNDRPLENPNTTGEFGSAPFTSGVHFNDLDATAFPSVKLSCSFAATSSSAFENGDYARIYVDKTNNGTYELLAAFETQNGLGNDSLSWDTDLDGEGDSTILSEAFQSFSFDIFGATIMDVRIEVLSSAGNEEIAFDSFEVRGNVVTNNFTASITNQTDVLCFGDTTGSLTVTVQDGASDYSYVWSNGDNTLNTSNTSNTISGLIAGTYTVTVTDGNGDVAIDSASISEPTALIVSIDMVSNESCVGLADGSATANVSGGTAPYSFLWSNNDSTATINGLSAGSYQLTVTDANGCIVQSSVNIIVQDTIDPTVQAQNITVYLDASGAATITTADVDNGSSDNCGLASLSVTPSSFNCTSVGANTVTLTATDANGNSSSTTSTVTVIDSTAPIASAQNVIVYLEASGAANITTADVDNGSSDNCSLSSLSVTPSSFNCTSVGANTVTLTATDANGNSSSATSTVTVRDSTAPTASAQNITVYLDASGAASITTADVDNGSSDNCGLASLSVTPSSFNCTSVGVNTITLTATDANGNSSSATSTVTVIDSTIPTASAQNITVYLDGSGAATITTADVDDGSSDNCGLSSLSVTPSSFNCTSVGANTITLTATDANGNSSSTTSTVTVIDSTIPTASAQNITVYLDASGAATITTADVDNGSSDNCGLAGLSVTPSSFNCTSVGANTVTLTATDANGNSSSATSIVTVLDTNSTAPQVQDVTVYLDATGNASIIPADIFSGGSGVCSSGSGSASIDISTFGCGDVGPNTVTLTFTDNNGNTSTATAIVTVVDSLMPTAIAQDVTLYLDAAGNATLSAADVDNGSSDACGIASTTISNTNFNCVAINGSGIQIASDSTWMESTVADSSNSLHFPWPGAALVPAANTFTLPVSIGQPYNFTTINPIPGSEVIRSHTHVRFYRKTFDLSSLAGISSRIRLSVDDDIEVYVNGQLVAGEYSFSQSSFQGVPHDLFMDGNGSTNGFNGGDPFGFVSPTTIDNILTIGTNEIILAVRNRQGNDRGGVTFVMDVNGTALGNPVILTVTDNNGNTAQDVANVTVVDTIAPVITNLPASFTAYTTSNDCTPAVFWQPPSADDACLVQSFVGTQTPGDNLPVGVTTVTYTATDVNGNMTSAAFDITVIDTTAPTASCQNITVSLDANGNASINASDVDNGSADACGIASTSIDVSSFNCSNIGANNVVLTVTDIYGNTSSCTAIVTVADQIAPTAIAQDAIVYLDANGNASITAADVNNGSNDNCGVASISVSPSNFNCSDLIGDNTLQIVSDSTWMESTVVDSSTALTFPWAGAPFVPASSTFTQAVEIGQPYGFITINPIPGSEVVRSHKHIRFYRKTFSLNSLSDLSTRIRMSVDDDMEIYINGHLLAGEYSFSQSSFQGVPHDLLIDSTGAVNGFNGGDAFGFVSGISLDSLFTLGNNEIIVAVRNRVGNDKGGFTLVMDVNADFSGNPVTLTVTDTSGNSSQALSNVTVLDTFAPVITQLPTSFTAYTTSDDCTPAVFWTLPIATDACAVQSLVATHRPSDNFPVGTTTVTYTALDESGNTSTASFDITVVDTTAPTTICQDITVTLDSTGNASISVADIDGGSTDACGIASSSIDRNTFSCSDVGAQLVTLTTTDIYGNTSNCTATVTVVGSSALQAVCQNIVIALDASGNANITAADIDNGSSALCGSPSLSIDQTTFDCSHVGINNVTLTVTDNTGNSTSCIAQVTVMDTIAPVIVAKDVVVALDANGQVVISPSDIDNGSSDACGIASFDVSPNTFDCNTLGSNTVTLTVTDNNGNSSSTNATVDVENSFGLQLSSINDIDLSCKSSVGGRYVSWDAPTAKTFSNCDSDTCVAGNFIPGFIFLGEYNGHRYFCSDNSNYTWSEANTAAQAAGGHLAVINSDQENHYLACRVQAYYSWIGLSDQNNEGSFEWVNGDAVNYTKWSSYEPNNTGGYYCGPGGADHTVLKRWSGKWFDRRECNKHEFIMEVPCGNDVVINQIAGPTSGSLFATGTTTITYSATDSVTGATDTTSFDVTIGDCTPTYCNVNGNTNYEWIQRVKIGSVDNTTGNDGGYADYTSFTTHANTGQWVNLKLYPGFAGKKFKEYWAVYVDWNNDGDFYDYKECVYTGKGKKMKSGSFKVPSWAAMGNLRVRVVMRWGGYGSSCGYCGYGEVEDYSLVIDNATGSGLNTKKGGSIADSDAPETGEIFAQEAFDLYPNPAQANGQITVSIRSAQTEESSLSIFNSVGKLIHTEKIQLRAGLNTLEITLQDLSVGTYFVKTDNQTEAIPFIVK